MLRSYGSLSNESWVFASLGFYNQAPVFVQIAWALVKEFNLKFITGIYIKSYGFLVMVT